MANEKLGVSYQQNRHQKVFYRGLYICAVGLDVLKFDQTSLFYSVSYFNWGEIWSFVSERLSPPKPTPVVTGLSGKSSAWFLMQLTWKRT